MGTLLAGTGFAGTGLAGRGPAGMGLAGRGPAGMGIEFVTQTQIEALVGAPRDAEDVAMRVALLDRAINQMAAGREVLLVGRSTGARVATRMAERRAIAATICLAYPFKNPHLVLEPERFAHLATLATPTLILQGSHDRYGGLDVAENYRLSPAITLRFFRGDHEFDLAAPACAHLHGLMRAFLQGRELPSPGFVFDEDFYRALYPDIDAAIIAGTLQSGETHYRHHGRAEGRRCRMRARG